MPAGNHITKAAPMSRADRRRFAASRMGSQTGVVPANRSSEGYGRFIGRTGALAVALGIGAAIASSPAVAFAEESGSKTSQAASSTTGSTNSESTGSGSGSTTGPSESTTDGPDGSLSSTTTTGPAASAPDTPDAEEPTGAEANPDVLSTSNKSKPSRAESKTAVTDTGSETDTDTLSAHTTTSQSPSTNTTSTQVDLEGVTSTAPSKVNTDTSPTDDPAAPAQGPGLLTLMGSARREQDTDAASTVTTSFAATATPVVDRAQQYSEALVNGHATIGTAIVDIMTMFGNPPPAGTAQTLTERLYFLNFLVNEALWSRIRQTIYFGPGQFHPLPVASEDLPVLWESNFDSLEEYQADWVVQEGRFGAGVSEQQYYSANNATVEDGKLVISIRRETPPDGKGAPFNYTSARVTTKGTASFEPPVRIVARMKVPTTPGLDTAFWTGGITGPTPNWPYEGEIDIVEYVGSTSKGKAWWTGNAVSARPDDPNTGSALVYLFKDAGVDLTKDYHDYGVDWHKDKIVWHIDGNEVGVLTKEQYEAIGMDWKAFSGEWQHYLILTTSVGNFWAGKPNVFSEFPQETLVDSVKVYSLAGI